VTLDGVMQAPGAPEEDTSGGFQWGGGSVNYWDEMMGKMIDDFMGKGLRSSLGPQDIRDIRGPLAIRQTRQPRLRDGGQDQRCQEICSLENARQSGLEGVNHHQGRRRKTACQSQNAERSGSAGPRQWQSHSNST